MARRAVSYVLTGMGSSIVLELHDRAIDLLSYVAGDPTTPESRVKDQNCQPISF
jgi:hypothetical protein